MNLEIFENYKAKWIQNSIAFAFILLTFASFYGLSLPFQERTMDAWESEQSNLINQFVFFSIFFLNVPAIFYRNNEIWKFITKERYLSLLIFYFIISFAWSDYSSISIKRSFQLFIMFITIVNTFIFLEEKFIYSSIKVIIIAYLIITYFVGFTVPEAIDPSFSTRPWRGITLQKNGLAQISFYIFILSLFFKDKRVRRNNINTDLLISIFSVFLIFLAQSSTVILALFFLLASSVLFKFDNLFNKIGIKKLLSILILLFFAIFIVFLSFFSGELLSFIPAIFGKDLTFTGRTFIWEYVINEIMKKPIIGYGYMTYWIMGSSRLDYILVNQSHNSYLEILLWGGILGFFLFIAFVFSYFKRAYILNNNTYLLSLAAILIIGFSEGILFQARTITTYILMFLYISLFKDFNKIKELNTTTINGSLY